MYECGSYVFCSYVSIIRYISFCTYYTIPYLLTFQCYSSLQNLIDEKCSYNLKSNHWYTVLLTMDLNE